MAALMKTHVQMSGDDAQTPLEDNSDQSDSEGGSNEDEGSDDGASDGGENDGDGEGGSDDEGSDDGASDGGENDGDGEGGSNGEEAENEDGGEDKGGDDGNANAGWADAMAKILAKKTPESKTGILTKSKELDKMKEKERQEQLERKKQVDKKRAWEMMCREKPDVVKDRETERALQRISTRGVVQLFNAVRKHQKTIDIKVKEVGGSERKKAKLLSSVSKKDFIDVLRTEGGSRVTGKTEKDTAAAAEEKPAWSVLTDDFMMGATMKDWDKDSDGEEADAPSGGGVEESDSD
ncbi:RRP15-like protein [Sebastes fasciatus]|uniref:RRP15-like protein n=1 Tax=Sebastes fasciatus TaxID=394691 RepID=UPI003D9DD97C